MDKSTCKEKYVKDQVTKLLKKYSCYRFMAVQSGYGAPTLDFLGCHKGRFFSVETKRPGKHLTARQKLTASFIEDAGGAVFVVGEEWHNELQEFSGMMELEAWLLLVR